jgi:toxin YoeB
MIKVLLWTEAAWHDYLYWQGQDKKVFKRINQLIIDTQKNPFTGIGKPELLKESLAGLYSRKIDHYNRLVYAIDGTQLTIITCVIFE